MKPFYLLILLALLLVSCKQQNAKRLPVMGWEELVIPAANNSHLGRLQATGDALYFSWVQSEDRMDSLFYSAYSKGEWKQAVPVSNGDDWFVNWADFPAISANGDKVLTNLLVKSDTGTYTYDVQLNLLQADTLMKAPFILHNDGTKSEHGFVSLLPWKDGFFATWLDGRNTAGGHHGHDGHGSGGAMTLRGAFIGVNGTISQDTQLDERICDCCQTAAALLPDGIIVAYRDRTKDEIRDISVVKYTEGLGWSTPEAISGDNWQIAGCPVNGPSLSSLGHQVALAWFSAPEGEGKVKVKYSEDGGNSFGDPIRLDGGFANGRVDVQWIDQQRLAVLWMEPKAEQDGLMLKILTAAGETLEIHHIATMDPSRASGFPQLELFENQLYVAWTDVGAQGKGAQIRMKRLNVAQ